MLIGLAGVTSTGKTTMATAIKERYGDRVEILSKISRQAIFDVIAENVGEYRRDNFTTIPHDLTLATEYERALFDFWRVKEQIKQELAMKEKFPDKPIIVDGCSIVKAAYLIYLSAPSIVTYFGDGVLTDVVESAIAHTDHYFNSIFYLPVGRVPFAKADHRVFRNRFIRQGQDAILHRLLSVELSRENVKVESFYNTDVNLVFDELAKLGVK